MTYVMRHEPLISAIKFMGYQTDETRSIGLQPLPSGIQIQCKCGFGGQNHLIFNKHLICPNNYIIYEGAEVTGVMSIEQFESAYKPLEYEYATFGEVIEEKEELKETIENAEA